MIQKLMLENSKKTELIQAWNKSSVALTEIQNSQKSFTDKTGLGFSNQDETHSKDIQAKLNMDKGKYIHFVKSVMVQEQAEPSKLIEQPTHNMSKGKICGIGYSPKVVTDSRSQPPKFFSKNYSRSYSNYYNCKPVQKRYWLNNQSKKGKSHVV